MHVQSIPAKNVKEILQRLLVHKDKSYLPAYSEPSLHPNDLPFGERKEQFFLEKREDG